MKTVRPVTNAFFQPALRQPQLQYRVNPHLRPTNHNRQAKRTFLSNPLSPSPQTLTASRTLPYPAKAIYAVISDVASYSQFIPYCRSSTVTKSSEPTEFDGQKYPEEAKLVVGFSNDVSESFWSRVYCSPQSLVVEALAGATETSLEAAEISHHHARPTADQDPSRNGDVLSHLSTKWTLRPYPYKPPPSSATSKETAHKNHHETSELEAQEKTEVRLVIVYTFANPMYAALSQAAAPKVAEKMIEAFQARVRKVVEGPAST